MANFPFKRAMIASSVQRMYRLTSGESPQQFYCLIVVCGKHAVTVKVETFLSDKLDLNKFDLENLFLKSNKTVWPDCHPDDQPRCFI